MVSIMALSGKSIDKMRLPLHSPARFGISRKVEKHILHPDVAVRVQG